MLQLATTSNDDDYQSAFTFVQMSDIVQGLQLAQAASYSIPLTWVQLDSQSTVSVFKNRNLVSDIWHSNTQLCVYSNGGTQTSQHVCTISNFGEVWFNSNSLANILSMAEVRKVCKITINTSIEAAMNVHHRDGSIMKLIKYRMGLYYFKTVKNNSTRLETTIRTTYFFTP
jgi:hypothetical protein